MFQILKKNEKAHHRGGSSIKYALNPERGVFQMCEKFIAVGAKNWLYFVGTGGKGVKKVWQGQGASVR